jgi:hypothetical protein
LSSVDTSKIFISKSSDNLLLLGRANSQKLVFAQQKK